MAGKEGGTPELVGIAAAMCSGPPPPGLRVAGVGAGPHWVAGDRRDRLTHATGRVGIEDAA